LYEVPEFCKFPADRKTALLGQILDSSNIRSFRHEPSWPIGTIALASTFSFWIVPTLLDPTQKVAGCLATISAVLFIALVIGVFSLAARIVVCPMIGLLNIFVGFRSITLGTNAFLVTLLVGIASLVMVVEFASFVSAWTASQRLKPLIGTEVRRRFCPFFVHDSNGCLHPVLVMTETIDGRDTCMLETGHGKLTRLEKGRYQLDSEFFGYPIWMSDDPNAP
jgi:hypothetical protein